MHAESLHARGRGRHVDVPHQPLAARGDIDGPQLPRGAGQTGVPARAEDGAAVLREARRLPAQSLRWQRTFAVEIGAREVELRACTTGPREDQGAVG